MSHKNGWWFVIRCSLNAIHSRTRRLERSLIRSPQNPQSPKLPLYKEILQILPKLQKNERRTKQTPLFFLPSANNPIPSESHWSPFTFPVRANTPCHSLCPMTSAQTTVPSSHIATAWTSSVERKSLSGKYRSLLWKNCEKIANYQKKCLSLQSLKRCCETGTSPMYQVLRSIDTTSMSV